MNTSERLLRMILRGHADKFKTVLQEELNERASVLLEQLYRIESEKVLKITESLAPVKPEAKPVNPVKKQPSFFPESAYNLRDGNVGILTDTERHMVAKLHESLNNDNKERVVKLLSESQESFNRVLKLAKDHNKK